LAFACQLTVGQTLASDLRHGQSEAFAVSHFAFAIFAIVVSKHLFFEVAVKMERFDTYVGVTPSASTSTSASEHALEAAGENDPVPKMF
jgi:hypothetical protein